MDGDMGITVILLLAALLGIVGLIAALLLLNAYLQRNK
jgi:hypothetical protein